MIEDEAAELESCDGKVYVYCHTPRRNVGVGDPLPRPPPFIYRLGNVKVHVSEYVDMWEESSSHFKPQPEDIHIKMMLRQNGSRSSLKCREVP